MGRDLIAAFSFFAGFASPLMKGVERNENN